MSLGSIRKSKHEHASLSLSAQLIVSSSLAQDNSTVHLEHFFGTGCIRGHGRFPSGNRRLFLSHPRPFISRVRHSALAPILLGPPGMSSGGSSARSCCHSNLAVRVTDSQRVISVRLRLFVDGPRSTPSGLQSFVWRGRGSIFARYGACTPLCSEHSPQGPQHAGNKRRSSACFPA